MIYKTISKFLVTMSDSENPRVSDSWRSGGQMHEAFQSLVLLLYNNFGHVRRHSLQRDGLNTTAVLVFSCALGQLHILEVEDDREIFFIFSIVGVGNTTFLPRTLLGVSKSYFFTIISIWRKYSYLSPQVTHIFPA